MKKVITALLITILIAVILILVSIDGLKREHRCLVFNLTDKDIDDGSFCDGKEIKLNGFEDSRFKNEKGSKFKWMIVEKNSVNCFFGLYSLTSEKQPEKENPDEFKLQDSNVNDIEKPSFPDVKADIVAVILKIDGNSESIEEAVEEIFLHFQTDFRQPAVFYIYGTKIPDRIKLLDKTEIIYIHNSPEILITDFSVIRSGDKDLYLKNNGTKRVTVK